MKIPVLHLALSLSITGAALAQNRVFTGQYSFGDSLSDSGNLFALARQPPAPYFNGRFSNGPTFVELLGQTIVPSATVSAAGANRNFAFGGATAAPGGQVPSLDQQIGAYRLQGLPARSTDLFTVLAGAYDLLGVLSSPATPANPGSLDVAGASTARAVTSNVRTLIGLGAKNLVVAGIPNLGSTPRALAQGGVGGAGATFGLRASTAFNNELRAGLQTLAAGASDVNLVYVDLQGILERVVLDHQALGYSNVTSFALAPSSQPGGLADPNQFVFFDDIHPTARTHALLASIVLEQLNPEGPLGATAMAGTAALALDALGRAALDARTAQLAGSTRAKGRLDTYASFNYGNGVRGAAGWRPRFSYDAQALTAGVDGRVGEGTSAGVAVGGGRLKATSRAGRFAVEDGTGRIYGVWDGGAVSLVLDGAYGAVRVMDSERVTGFGGLPARGKTSGSHWGAGLAARWNTRFGGASLQPWAGLRTARVRLDGYTERDLPALAMEYAEQEARSSSGALGVDVGWVSRMAARPARFDLRLAWHGELGSRTREVAGRLAQNFTRPTVLSVEDGDGDGVELGGAATIYFSKNWGASVGYAADVRSGERVAHRGTVSLQTGF